MNLKRITLDDTVEETVNKINENLTDIEENVSRLEAEFIPYKDNITLKISKIEKELNDYKATIQQVNINQEPKQKATGYGVISLPPNAAEGQVGVSVKGNTETDEEGNTKSTVGAIRLKTVGKNLFNWEKEVINDDNITYEEVDGRRCLVWVAGSKAGSMRIMDGMFEENKQYTFSGYVKAKPAASLMIQYTDGTSQAIIVGSNIVDRFIKVNVTSEQNKTIKYLNGTWHSAQKVYMDIDTFQVEKGTQATEYEPYKESTMYVVAKDEEGNILELHSLPNGVKDEIRVSENKLIKRIGEKTNVARGTVINYADMADNGIYYAWNDDGETETGVKGNTLGINATKLIYQLAIPVATPVQVSGSLVSYPSGTVYIKPFVADAGIYTDKMTVLHQDLPIKTLEKLSKIDFMTGLETKLDITAAVISEDKLSFTHPDLVNGDIVFFTYEYDRESTEGETEIEYYDSRYVVKDSVTGKFYKWHITVANGVPSIELKEV